MKPHPPVLRRSLFLGLLLALTLAACGPASTQSTDPPTAAPAAAATATATAAPAATTAPADTTGQGVAAGQGQGATNGQAARINLNTATADQILTIPGVGQRMVREFQEYRPYVSILQFRREIGKYVDNQQVAAYEEYVYVPIAINDADADTLQQIPGLDAGEAAALIDGRPYDSVDAFLAALAPYISAGDQALAQSMVVEQ